MSTPRPPRGVVRVPSSHHPHPRRRSACATCTTTLTAQDDAGARSYTDVYGSFVILARFADGNEFRFDFFRGHGGPLSMIQAGVASVVERTEICG